MRSLRRPRDVQPSASFRSAPWMLRRAIESTAMREVGGKDVWLRLGPELRVHAAKRACLRCGVGWADFLNAIAPLVEADRRRGDGWLGVAVDPPLALR